MSITDELRERIAAMCKVSGLDGERLYAIADRIDAAHAKAVERARMDGMDATFGDGWVKLPTDADGVPIHVGDVVEYDGVSEKVTTLSFWSGGWNINTEYGDFDGRRVKGYELELLDHPELFRHVKPDSWERIIEDAVKNGMYDHDNERIQQKLVERCRRLAGEV